MVEVGCDLIEIVAIRETCVMPARQAVIAVSGRIGEGRKGKAHLSELFA